jgi:hypothetical protein
MQEVSGSIPLTSTSQMQIAFGCFRQFDEAAARSVAEVM